MRDSLSFDQILGLIGELGPAQIKLMLLVCLSALPEAMHSMMAVFLTVDLDHWCSVEEWTQSVEDCNQYRDDNTDAYLNCLHRYRNSSIPRYLEDGEVVYEQCIKYDAVYPSAWYEGYYAGEVTNSTKDCDEGWVYDRSQYKASVVNDFDLVCGQQYLADTSQSLFYVGYLIGSIVSGSLADIIGRYKTFFFFIAWTFVCGFIMSFAPFFWFFCLFRCLVGMGNISIYLMSFVIVTELVGPSYRVYAGIATPLAFSVGSMILAVFAFFLRDWRNLQRTCSLCFLPLFLLVFVLPESPRWLMARNKFEDTEKILQKIAKGNKKADKLPKDFVEQLEKQEEERRRNATTGTLIDLFRTPRMRRSTILLYCLWCVNSLIYFGLSLNTADLGDNDYVTFFISAAVEFPANLIVIPLIQSRLGRRYSEFGILFIGGVCCLITSFLDNSTATTAVAMTGKLCITSSVTIAYIYTTEAFPTTLRGVGLGSCSTVSRIGSILAPMMLALGDIFDGLHLIIFGICALIASLLVLLLPETRGVPLKQTVEDIEMNTSDAASDVSDEKAREKAFQDKGTSTDETTVTCSKKGKGEGYDNQSYITE